MRCLWKWKKVSIAPRNLSSFDSWRFLMIPDPRQHLWLPSYSSVELQNDKYRTRTSGEQQFFLRYVFKKINAKNFLRSLKKEKDVPNRKLSSLLSNGQIDKLCSSYWINVHQYRAGICVSLIKTRVLYRRIWSALKYHVWDRIYVLNLLRFSS